MNLEAIQVCCFLTLLTSEVGTTEGQYITAQGGIETSWMEKGKNILH